MQIHLSQRASSPRSPIQRKASRLRRIGSLRSFQSLKFPRQMQDRAAVAPVTHQKVTSVSEENHGSASSCSQEAPAPALSSSQSQENSAQDRLSGMSYACPSVLLLKSALSAEFHLICHSNVLTSPSAPALRRIRCYFMRIFCR